MHCMKIWTALLILYVGSAASIEEIGIKKFNPYTLLPPTTALPFFCDDKDVGNDDVHCYGKQLLEIPNNLTSSLKKLTVTDSNIKYIKRSSMNPYRETLRDITLSNLPFLRVIEEGTFAKMPNLRTLYISHAPQLKFLHGLLTGVTSSTFYSLRIVWTGLLEVPDLFALPQNNTMFLLDLDHNKIERLPKNSIKITAQQVTLNFNDLHSIDDYAFNGSQIAELYIHTNPRLSKIGRYAFKGTKSLRLLDLSQTSIVSLPTEGLKELETLKIKETPTMQTIPSIYDLRNLKQAKLTHSFHCCAFKYPEQHNPPKHAEYEENMKKICRDSINQANNFPVGSRKRRSAQKPVYSYYVPATGLTNEKLNNVSVTKPLLPKGFNDLDKMPLKPLTGQTIEHQKGKTLKIENEDDGFFHPNPTKINDSQLDALCGKIIFRKLLKTRQEQTKCKNA